MWRHLARRPSADAFGSVLPLPPAMRSRFGLSVPRRRRRREPMFDSRVDPRSSDCVFLPRTDDRLLICRQLELLTELLLLLLLLLLIALLPRTDDRLLNFRQRELLTELLLLLLIAFVPRPHFEWFEFRSLQTLSLNFEQIRSAQIVSVFNMASYNDVFGDDDSPSWLTATKESDDEERFRNGRIASIRWQRNAFFTVVLWTGHLCFVASVSNAEKWLRTLQRVRFTARTVDQLDQRFRHGELNNDRFCRGIRVEWNGMEWRVASRHSQWTQSSLSTPKYIAPTSAAPLLLWMSMPDEKVDLKIQKWL
ncbi:hypothetical protein MARPO_0186s0021 [Marchantia polymorpha]|uniref:Uncharacterized protein n=1 Tax=Marchantia polymorpha TaxID=3197 RepID=A0A2R6W1K3_MARPO|nr:hypothetical protein MARPO_0186s0021 [Marchantia polymorpha]|eukprot:PTQ27722.1 hypothetical protein MARPO_0186s0021 [Marchantia polymorpha]